MSAPPPKVALLAGASGLVGGYCLSRLLASSAYRRIIVVTRRDLADLVADRRIDQIVVDFAQLEAVRSELGADHVFCATGTTIAIAGTRARFREVDYDYPLALARLTRAEGATHFSLVSSLGANPESRVFYTRVKGELERAIAGLGFPGVTIVRPSVIAGPRREFRLGERVGRWMLALAPRRWRPVHADAIAEAMVTSATVARPGVEIVESHRIG